MLHTIAIISLIVAGICSLIVAAHVIRQPQKMWIMNFVWILTPLYASVLGLWAYYELGRLTTKENVETAKQRGEESPGKRKPFWQSVAVGAMHCGSGCTLGDIIAEWFIFFVPFTLFGRKIFGGWALDFVVAFLIGIAFQYFTIAPMRGLSVKDGIVAAVKADTLSLSRGKSECMDGDCDVCDFRARTQTIRSGFLVYDADCDARRIFDELSG